jgi:hypothetical protein
MSISLNLHQNLDDFDDFYDMLSDSHHNLNEAQSKMLDAQLVLLLANHIGDLNVLREAFARARVTVEQAMPHPGS